MFAMMCWARNRQPVGKCPFLDLPNCKADPFNQMVTPEEMALVSWINPDQEIEIAFTEWTRWGALRQAEIASP